MFARSAKLLGVFAVTLLAGSALADAAPRHATPNLGYGQHFPRFGELDCNGYSRIQFPIAHLPCADLANDDNEHYIGHDEPEVQFFSSARHSGSNLQWSLTMPIDNPLPASQTFENEIAFWLGMTLCDPNSYPQNPCAPDSDTNPSGPGNPNAAGSGFLEMQFYPPGLPRWPTAVSCDLTRWCASMSVFSLECNYGYRYCNPNCEEPLNFAFVQTDGVPTGPPGPADATIKTFTPNAQTLLMNQGDQIRVTIKDSKKGLVTQIEDLTSGQSGFMVASIHNGFEHLGLGTCAPTKFAFHPEFSTAKMSNMLPWSIGIINIAYSPEIGHFERGHGDGDGDDPPCFSGPVLPGCLGADTDFDGTSYRPDWPNGTRKHAVSIAIGSVLGNGVGPMSFARGRYRNGYDTMQFVTGVPASESTCRPNGAGCSVPPPGAKFYPFYGLSAAGAACFMTFGNDIRGSTTNDFGGVVQWGSYDLNVPGTFQSGPFANPCTPKAAG